MISNHFISNHTQHWIRRHSKFTVSAPKISAVCLRCESHSRRADLILALLGQLIVRLPISFYN